MTSVMSPVGGHRISTPLMTVGARKVGNLGIYRRPPLLYEPPLSSLLRFPIKRVPPHFNGYFAKFEEPMKSIIFNFPFQKSLSAGECQLKFDAHSKVFK